MSPGGMNRSSIRVFPAGTRTPRKAPFTTTVDRSPPAEWLADWARQPSGEPREVATRVGRGVVTASSIRPGRAASAVTATSCGGWAARSAA